MKFILLTGVLCLCVSTFAQEQKNTEPQGSKLFTESFLDSLEKRVQDRNFPWLEENGQNFNHNQIYIPDNYDYKIVEALLLRSNGFGPGNGGNQYIFEADSIARDIVQILEENPDQFSEVNISKFKRLLKETGLFFVSELPDEDLRELEGMNFSNDRIILIKSSAWESLNVTQKRRLLFHEYLGVMGLEKNNAYISNRINTIEFHSIAKEEINIEDLKWIYTSKNSENLALSIRLKLDGTGQYISREGSRTVTWKKENSRILISLDSKLSTIGYPVLQNPFTGRTEQVQRTYSLLSLEIYRKDTGFISIQWTTETCDLFDTGNGQPSAIECKNKVEIEDNLTAQDKLNALAVRIAEGDLIVLPQLNGDRDESLLHELYKDRAVLSPLNWANLPIGSQIESNIPTARDFAVTNWVFADNTLFYKTASGYSYELRVIKSLHGLDRAIVYASNGNTQRVFFAPFIVIPGGQVPKMTQSDFYGDFLPIYSGVRHTLEEQEPYSFAQDHTGGFASGSFSPDGTRSSFYNHWYWMMTPQGAYAARYRYKDTFGVPQSKEEVLDCASSNRDCYVYNGRTYIPLRISGNRYTFLRVFSYMRTKQELSGSNSTKSDRHKIESINSEYSIWVMDKL